MSEKEILHWKCEEKNELKSSGYLPAKEPLRIIITSGASCPDALVENVIRRLLSFYGLEGKIEQMIAAYGG